MEKQTSKDIWIENYNSRIMAEMWGGHVNWPERRRKEDGFLVKQLNSNNCKQIFDSCLGDGCDSIHLIQSGFNVTSNEIDKEFRRIAKLNAERLGISLNLTEYDWRDLDEYKPYKKFDAITCTGNSFCYLFSRESQIKALKNFYNLIEKEGILIIDERNFQFMLDNRKDILAGRYEGLNKYLYCGKDVHPYPRKISADVVVMEISNHSISRKGNLYFYPFRRNQLLNLLKESGFKNIERFSDYKKEFNPNSEFYQYVCYK